jgi:sodium/proline symporter
MILFCFIFYIAAQFDAAAIAFVNQFSMSKASSLLLGASIILLYCLLGGFWAASVTDTLQAAIMLAAAILVPSVAVWHAGGPTQIVHTLSTADHAAFTDWTGGLPGHLFIGFLLGVWGIGLGALGQPHLVARLMAVRGERERRQGFVISITWAVLILSCMAALAIAARSLMIASEDGEQLFYVVAGQYLPPVLAGIVIAAILSAVMSTVDSLLLAASASVSHDLQLGKRAGFDAMWVSRMAMTAIVVAAVLLALVLPDTIFNRVLFAWSALGSAFGPILVIRVLGHEPAACARFWSIACGFGLTVLFYTLGTMGGDVSSLALHFLVKLAQLPGDPFERILPWIPSLLILRYAAPQYKLAD